MRSRRGTPLPRRNPPARVAGADDASIADLVARDRSYGEIVCLCEMVTAGEVLAAAHGPVPARTLDALKRRLWVAAGACQGAQCIARLTALLAGELEGDAAQVRKNVAGSEVVV